MPTAAIRRTRSPRTKCETPATNITIRGCTIKYGSFAGILADKGGDDITISENSFHEFTQGINLNLGSIALMADRVTIAKNYLDGGEAGHNKWFADNADAAAIYGEPGGYWIIEENLVDRAAGHVQDAPRRGRPLGPPGPGLADAARGTRGAAPARVDRGCGRAGSQREPTICFCRRRIYIRRCLI